MDATLGAAAEESPAQWPTLTTTTTTTRPQLPLYEAKLKEE